MNQRATDTPEQVLKFAPKEKQQTRIAPLDDAGQAIVAQIRTAAGLAKDDCDLEIPFPGNRRPSQAGTGVSRWSRPHLSR